MQTLVAIWLAGGAICALVYIVGIWPAFREHTPTAGVAIEVFHFGIRALMVFVAWPVVAVVFCVVAVGSRQRSRVRSPDAEQITAPDGDKRS